MAFFELEHGTIAYRVDAGFYAVAVAAVGVSLMDEATRGRRRRST